MSWADIQDALKGDNNKSVGTRIGLYIDPLHYLSKVFGKQKQYDAFVNKSGDFLNKQASSVVKPIDKFARKYDPLHKEITSSEEGDKAATWIANKPATAAGAVLGGIFGGQALAGLGGGGGGGAFGMGQGAGEALGMSGGGLGGGAAGGSAGIGGGLGGGIGAGAAGAGWAADTNPMQSFANQSFGQGNRGLVMDGGAGTGSPGWMQQAQGYAEQAGGMMNNGQQQQQQQAPPPTFMGRLGNAMLPIDSETSKNVDPNYVSQARQRALLTLGLGMMSNAHQGGRLGESLAAGYGLAQGGFNKDIEGAYQRGVQARAERRADDRQDTLDTRYADEQSYKKERDKAEDAQKDREFKATQQYRKESLASLERRAAAKVPGTTMSEDAIELAAGRIVNGEKAKDVLANFGRGNQGSANITAVQNRVAAMAKERGMSVQEFAVVNQELSAQARARTELGAREGKIAARVEEAKQFADIAGKASAEVPRGSFVPVSRLLQMADTQLSDPKLAAFKAANVSLINAYAAAVGGGVPTVHDKEAAEKMLSTAQSPEAYQAVVNQLITEMNAALQAPRSVMEEMRQHDLGGGLGSPGTGADDPLGIRR